jgi:ParB-like chromosome segregation protein Spo0J
MTGSDHEGLTSGLATLRMGPVERVSVDALQLGESPRQVTINRRHVSMLASVESPLPPLLVGRDDLAVIDGAHRLLAARMRGDTEVDVRLIDGAHDDIFVLSVRANVRHGRPLTPVEREQSARRILATHPDWSDRTIATACGLATKTIRVMRRCSTGSGSQLNGVRLGRDGRTRPLDPDEGRRRAVEVLTRSPGASLREVAREVGISPATVRDVRARLERGDSPLIAGPSPLTADAALRSMDGGESFVAWMEAHDIDDEWSRFVQAVPASRLYLVADQARAYADAWRAFADALEARANRRSTPRTSRSTAV